MVSGIGIAIPGDTGQCIQLYCLRRQCACKLSWIPPACESASPSFLVCISSSTTNTILCMQHMWSAAQVCDVKTAMQD